MKLLVFLVFSAFALSQEPSGQCQSNPLKDKEYCKYFWALCKGLGIKRLEAIKSCLEKSQSYDEGVKCFERSWIEDLFTR
ncbi:MAG: hypothetical protein ACK4LT_02040 [Aquificaceae bacterium]